MHEFEQLEDAIVAALVPLKTLGLRTLDTYSGQFDVEDIEAMTLQFPCIYVAMTGLGLVEDNRYDRYAIDVLLLTGDRNVRGAVAAARGDGASPGIYALLTAAREKLHRKKLIASWTPLSLQTETPLVYAPQDSICLYAATYRTKAVK